MIENQELHCHNCNRYVQFPMDMSLNGNHVLRCPNCGHEHCRVVKDGVITNDRWDSRNSTYIITSATTSASSTWTTYTSMGTTSASNLTSDSARTFLYNSWSNTVTY